MSVPRWIQDNNPEESIQSRIEKILFEINNQTMNERELFGWVASELLSILNYLRSK